MVIDIDQLRQAEKHPSTFFRPQLEGRNYDPKSGQPLDWQDVGRESWQWHQREKAGMRIGGGLPDADAPALKSENDADGVPPDLTADDPGGPHRL